MEHLLRRAGVAVDVRLWALDEAPPELAAWTVGVGRGGKFDLLNRCMAARPMDESAYVLLLDDDFVFLDGTFTRLVQHAEAASLGIAQPAHAWSSFVSHDITKRRRLTKVRRTEFVEIGPAFAVAPAWRDRVLPFRANAGMGWSIQLDLYELVRSGCTVGIVDATRILHLARMGADYHPPAEVERMRALAAEVGLELDDLDASMRTIDRWFRWRPTPPWSPP
ncbi:MAG: hypothetical protein ACYCWW_14045 [Deltaproteobacteria bacterium]